MAKLTVVYSSGDWWVASEGKPCAGPLKTNALAWRCVDRKMNEPHNAKEALPPHKQAPPGGFLSSAGKWITIIFLIGGIWVMLRGEPVVLTTTPVIGAAGIGR